MKKQNYTVNSFRPCNIVEAKSNLSKSENDIVDIICSIINNETVEEKDNLWYEITIADYKKMYSMTNQSHVYEMLRKACKTIMNKHFILWDEFDGEHDFQWVSAVHYKKNEGRIVVELGASVKKLFLESKGDTYFPLIVSLKLSSQYSQRLYYMLKRYVDTGVRYENPERLMKSLMVPESYSYQKFKERIIEQAMLEINAKTDISFTYKEDFVASRGKSGKRINKITFFIKRNNMSESLAEIEKLAMAYRLTNQEAKCIILTARKNNVTYDNMCQRIDFAKNKIGVHNFIGFCIYLMDNENWEKYKDKNDANDFQTRELTPRYFELLEKKLTEGLTDDEKRELLELS